MKVIICFAVLVVCAQFAHGFSFVVGDNTELFVEKENCAPKQWEGFTSSWYPEFNTLALMNISYDFKNKMLALDVQRMIFLDSNPPSKMNYSMILRYDKKKVYFFYKDGKGDEQCFVKELEEKFDQLCVPKDAKQRGTFTIGGKLTVKPDNDVSWVFFEMTKDGIPVSAKYGNSRAKGVTDFYNITPGIDDPDNRFTPPDACENKTATPSVYSSFSFWQFPFLM